MLVDMVSVDYQSQWKKMKDKFYQAQIRKRKSSDDMINDFERFNDIRGLCDRFEWNVINNDSHIFILTSYKIWDKLVCSLSDIDLNSTYEYVCQYGL